MLEKVAVLMKGYLQSMKSKYSRKSFVILMTRHLKNQMIKKKDKQESASTISEEVQEICESDKLQSIWGKHIQNGS